MPPAGLVADERFTAELQRLWDRRRVLPGQARDVVLEDWREQPLWLRVHRHVSILPFVELWQERANNREALALAAPVLVRSLLYDEPPELPGRVVPEPLARRIDAAIIENFSWIYGDATGDALRLGLSATIEELVAELDAARNAGEEPAPDQMSQVAVLVNARDWMLAREQLGPGGRIDRRINELRRIVDDKLVFIGINMTGSAVDTAISPLGAQTPGVVAHAAVANGILTSPRHLLREAPTTGSIVTALILGFFSAAAATLISPKRSWIALLVFAGGVTVVNAIGFFDFLNTVVELATPLASIAASFAGCTTYRAIQFRRERAAIRAQFAARVSPQLVDILVDNPQLMNMAGESRRITTVFTDFAGFTAVSESLSDQEIVGVINLYLRQLAEELMDEGAYINKFLGDGIMAFWGAPTSTGEDETHGVRAAIRLFDVMDRVNDEQEEKGFKRLGMRIGMSTGEVIVGDCGAPPTLNDYTVIGDAVNLAARLESASKQFGVNMLMTQETLEAADPDLVKDILWRPMGRIRVVGQSQGQRIVDVIGRRTSTDADKEYEQIIELTTKAVEHYANKEYEQSMDLWRELVLMPHGSAGALMYIDYIDSLIREDRADPTLPLRSK